MARSSQSLPPARLLLVFPGSTLVHKAVRAGLDVRVVLDGEQRAEDFPLSSDRVARVDGSRGSGIAVVIRDLIDEHHVSHVLDGGGSPLREHLPTAGPDDDLFGRELVPSWRSAVEKCSVATVDEVRKVVEDLGWQAVIRTDGDEVAVRSREDADGWARAHESHPGPFAVEERASAPEVVATTLTVDGMHRVVGITERVEDADARSYVYPASLPELRMVRVRAAVTSMLDLVGHEFGPAQTRVALTGPEPRVLRSRPCFDVDGIPNLIEAATGFDLPTELFRTLAGALLQPPRPRWSAGARFFRVPGFRTGGGESGVFVEGVSPEVVRARLDETGASSD
ncbi:hypothetical protein [Umezawaea sp. Da 62-37]|uniref:hypothetical protein n=1 Tax=Umezawaea sp. Da 62-37 TaxID=3075927 RepID=UPI0028F7010D|nr:hypothetical protein [Umezawaea sp. Da 62-37]WNV87666.1 hypothetical protein RM788_05055 [Umezawaea sp. Da 62-37]